MVWATLKRHILLCLTLVLLFLIYLFCAPYTVQTGDSGELTAAAAKLFVPHPPGYPFWIWINHLWIEYTSFNSTFFASSVFNSVQAILTLTMLALLIRNSSIKLVAIVSLGLSPLFWKYAELPEVFMLNVLLSFLVIHAGLMKRKIPKTDIPAAVILVPLFFSLGIAHHQTIVFLLPFVLWICWQFRKSLYLYLSILSGIMVCGGLYLSLLKLNPESINSWGLLQSPIDVLKHVLRTEYGTFSLHASSDEKQTLAILLFYGRTLLANTWPVLILSLFVLLHRLIKKEKIIWETSWTPIVVSLLLYSFIFIPMTRIPPANFLADVLERFFVFPISILTLFTCLFISANCSFSPKITKVFLAFSLLIIGQSLLLHFKENDLSKNTIVEDYASNLLNNAATHQNPLILATSDTELFAIKYLQTVNYIHPEILVGSIHQFKQGPFILKAKAKAPLLHLDYDKITQSKVLYVIEDLIIPNAKNFAIIADDDEYPPDLLRITVLPVGFLLQEGAGMDVKKSNFVPELRSNATVVTTPLNKFSYFRAILTKYSYFFVLSGIHSAKDGDNAAAVGYFERALEITPYAIPPLKNLCMLIAEKEQDPRCLSLKDSQTFDYFRFNNKRSPQ